MCESAPIYDLEPYRVSGPPGLCSCGRTHRAETDFIIVEPEISKWIPSVLSKYQIKNSVAIFDNRTRQISEKAGILEALQAQEIVLSRPEALVPDERAVFELISQIPKSADVLFAVGSGTINDLVKYCAYLLNLPYFCIATAPSMDGFVSGVSPLNVCGTKITYPAAPPKAVLADLNILKDAPMRMIAAGAGDILGKYTALSDWKLAHAVKGEYYCSKIAGMMEQALEKTVSSIPGLIERDKASVQALMQALVLSGTAMSYAGNSRPASGAEHHLSHYFELLYLKRGRKPEFHGVKVALGLLMVRLAYDSLKTEPKIETIEAQLPSYDKLRQDMQKLSLPVSPREIGLSKDETYQGLLHARELRDRFTIMDYAFEAGCLEKTAGRIIDVLF